MLFSVLATLAGDFALLAACRIAQGAIAGLIQPLAMVTMVDVFPCGSAAAPCRSMAWASCSRRRWGRWRAASWSTTSAGARCSW